MINILDGQTDELLAYLDGQGDGIYISDEIEQDINGLSTLRFTALSGSEAAVHLRDFNRVLVPHDRLGWQEYVIYETEIDDNLITVYCIGSETAINARKVIDPGKYNGYTLKQYVTLATSGTEWAMGNVEFAGTHTLTFDEYTRPYDFLKTVERAFDMELSFRVEVAGSRVIGRYVDVYEAIGSGYVGKEFVNAKDLIGVQKKIHNDRIVTAFEVIGPKPKKGEPLRTFVSDEDAFQRWNYKGLHIVDLFTPDWKGDEDMTLFQLQAAAESALKKRIDSVVEYTITVADLSPILGHEVTYLGDSVRIKDTDFNPPLYAEARIINVKRPIRNDEDLVEKTYTIGEVVEYSEDSILAKFKAMQAAYGLRVVKSATAPVGNFDIIWIKTDPSSSFEISHSWDGTKWVPMTAKTPAELGAETPDGARSKSLAMYNNVVDTEKKQIIDRYTAIYNSPDLKAGTAKTELLTAKTAYDTAYTQLMTDIATAQTDGTTTVAEKAVVDASYATYGTRLGTLNSKAEAATRAIEGDKVQASANGKNTVFYQDAAPSVTGRITNDTWFDTNDGNRLYSFIGGAWVAEQFGVNAIADLAITNAKIANATIESAKIVSLDAAKISALNLSAITADLGTVTAGIFKNAAGTNIIDMTNGTISFGSGKLVVTALGEVTLSGKVQVNGASVLGGTNSVTIENGTVVGMYQDEVSTTTMTTNDGNYEVKETVHALGNRPIRRSQLGQQGVKMWSSALAVPETFVMFGTQVTNEQIKALVLADLGIILSTTTGVVIESNDNALTLEYPAGDNGYIAYTEDRVRQAYVGFGGNGANHFTLQNDRVDGAHVLTGLSGGHRLVIDTNGSDGHTRLRGSNGPLIKFLKTLGVIQFRNFADDGYATLHAAEFFVASNRDVKKDITPYEGDALKAIISTPIREYRYKSDQDWEIKRLGVIVDESPLEIISLSGAGVDAYPMAALAWKAIQELSAQVTELRATISEMEAKY